MRHTTRELETIAVQGRKRDEKLCGSIVHPIFQGTIYEVLEDIDHADLPYHRLGTTPSQTHLHSRLAALAGSEAALAFSSGTAAFTSILLGELEPGDHIIAGSRLYGGTASFLSHQAERLGWSYTLVDDCDPESWSAALRPQSKVFLTEAITNPLVRVPRLGAVVEFCRAHHLRSIIDATFATPINLRPLALGFDIAWHSATKYLNGHSDLVAGCMMADAETVSRARHAMTSFGGCLDPGAGFLLERGLKTLVVRMRAHNSNALAIAQALASNPAIVSVNYPGLPDHPDHEHARELFAGFGGMLSFRPKGGPDASQRLMETLELPAMAPSLGGVESLMTRPVMTSHAGMSPAERAAAGVDDDLIRMSVGIESAKDLIADLERGLASLS